MPAHGSDYMAISSTCLVDALKILGHILQSNPSKEAGA